jgi:hypothetical protein
MRFKEWHDQIAAYEKRHPDKKFGLAYTGGKPYQNARIWVSIPMEEFQSFLVLQSTEKLLAVIDKLKEG